MNTVCHAMPSASIYPELFLLSAELRTYSESGRWLTPLIPAGGRQAEDECFRSDTSRDEFQTTEGYVVRPCHQTKPNNQVVHASRVTRYLKACPYRMSKSISACLLKHISFYFSLRTKTFTILPRSE